MYSPKKNQARINSSNGQRKSNFVQESSSPVTNNVNSTEAQSSKIREPYVQDTLNRLTSPYKRSHDYSAAKISNIGQFEVLSKSSVDNISHNISTPKKPKIQSASRVSTADKSKSHRGDEEFNSFPIQGKVEDDLKGSLTSLKVVMRDYEEKQKEKRTLQKVVDQLKLQIESLKARKNNFTKNFEKLHKDSLLMNDATTHKENQRKLIEKNIEQVRTVVVNHDKDIQESISQNVDVANGIKAEQLAVLKMKEKISELKKNIASEMKDKEKARSDLKVSSKQLKSSEQKYELLMKEKASYVSTINSSKSIKV